VVHSEGATTLAANPTNNVMSNGGTPTGGFKWSTTVPTTAYDGPVLLKCAAGNMGNTAYNGVNCLLQYNPEDYNGRTLEICQNVVGVAGCYPVFQTTRLGLTAANQIHINSTNYGDTTNYLPTGFPSQGDGCSAALCIMNDTPQIGSLYANFRNFALATNRYSGTPPPFEERHCNVLTNGYNVTQSDLCYLATDARQGASGVGIMHEYVKYRVRSTAQLDATSTTTLADITGLSVYVEATRTYEFDHALVSGGDWWYRHGDVSASNSHLVPFLDLDKLSWNGNLDYVDQRLQWKHVRYRGRGRSAVARDRSRQRSRDVDGSRCPRDLQRLDHFIPD
jgi:hypothetical protein